jgi:glycosyltransferase involved in cell wall biosynthesis
LNSFCPQLEIYVSPFPSPEEPMPVALRFDKPVQNFIFVSSQHHPNVDGLRWFMKEVWPEIKKCTPDAVIEIIGKWPQSAQTSLPHYDDIQFTGFVPQLSQALQNKIMIVPVWVGSGIRTKILAAWSSSCPVITTTVGVEGLPGQNGEHFMVADNASAFASACIDLAQNVNQLNRVAANALDLVKKHYSLAAVRKTRLNVYETMLAKHRSLQKP